VVWVKLFFKCAVGKFLNPSGRLECRQGQVGLCQGTAKLSAVFSCPFFGCVGRSTLAGNGLQIDVGGLSKLTVSIPTKGYLKINVY
jgi:hypothetical protein